jgi:ParB family chromosome partitioning protein
MSNKSKLLGTGSSFVQTQAVSARRQAINAATKAPTEGAPPPVRLPVDLISLNPANPRTDLGDLTDLAASLRDHGQKTAISIMSRFAYLEANPDVENELEDGTRYVAIDGNSRLAAAREAGLETIKVMLDEELGSNPDEVLESALVANVHRQDLDHLDEARALQQLLGVHKTQEALAARLHRSQAWVSQRLALLGLTPELKEKLVSGEEPVELLRRVGKKKPEEQAEHLERLKAKRQEKAPQQTQSTRSAADDAVPDRDAEAHNDVMKPAAPAPSGRSLQTVETATAVVPDQRPQPGPATDRKQEDPTLIEWTDGPSSMDIAYTQWSRASQRRPALGRFIELVGGPDLLAADLAATSSPEYRRELIEHLSKTL